MKTVSCVRFGLLGIFLCTVFLSGLDYQLRPTLNFQKALNMSANPNLSCPKVSPLLKGLQNLSLDEEWETETENWPPTLEELAVENTRLTLGGYYPGPSDCRAKKTVAIIVPYRQRQEQLRYFLYYMHGILQRQQQRYIFVVVEQDDTLQFNRALLLNVGFKYLTDKFGSLNIDCFFFHDVDIITEDDRTTYECHGDGAVVHMSAQLKRNKYKFCCGMSVGGILAMTRRQVEKINGFSNSYIGWGGEDDDMLRRIMQIGRFRVDRLIGEQYRFRMISHTREKLNDLNPKRWSLLDTWRSRQPTDGQNSLDLSTIKVVKHLSHTRIYVSSQEVVKKVQQIVAQRQAVPQISVKQIPVVQRPAAPDLPKEPQNKKPQPEWEKQEPSKELDKKKQPTETKQTENEKPESEEPEPPKEPENEKPPPESEEPEPAKEPEKTEK